MTEIITTTGTPKQTEAPPPEVAEHAPCDGGHIDEACDAAAVAIYTLPWGDTGACCTHHKRLIDQRMATMGKSASYSPLPAALKKELSRDERIKFHAEILALKEEVAAAKARGLDLYQHNARLANEARMHAARNQHVETQLKDLEAELEKERTAHNKTLAELGDAVNRAAELQAILPKIPEHSPDK